MASHFLLELDTTAPAVSLQASQGAQESLVVLDIAADLDAAEIKVWGSIDPTDPGNANYSETMGAAEWFPFDAQLIVRMAPGGGTKTFSVLVRDDVWNESQVTTVQFGMAEEPRTPPPPGWPFPPRRKKRRDSSRTIESRSRTAIVSSSEVRRLVRSISSESVLAIVSGSASVLRRRQIEASTVLRIDSASGSARVVQAPPASALAFVSEFEIVRHRGQADDDAIVALLL